MDNNFVITESYNQYIRDSIYIEEKSHGYSTQIIENVL
jgi:hypothetical protein